jgi:hypothetical protein
MLPHPAHDIWTGDFDLLEDRPTLKACNLVCARWHSQLQPRLLLSIEVGPHIATADDVRALLELSHLARSLCMRDWVPADRPLPHLLTPNAIQHITQLELNNIQFETFLDIHQ